MLAYYLIRLSNDSQSLEIVNRIMDSGQEDPSILFWSALIYEWAGNREGALETLAAAAVAGYSSAVIQATADLDDLRKDPQYRDLVESVW